MGIQIIAEFLTLGAVAGFLAGLFGIGGGLIIVPVLVYLLPQLGIPSEQLMSVALGTSFSTIVITTFSAAQRHHKNGNLVWSVAKVMIPSLMVMVFITGFFVSAIPKAMMTKIFAIMVVLLALKMIISLKPNLVETKPLTTKSMIIAGGIIGVLSSFAGIAGGAFIVPYLSSRGLDMRKAIGTSSVAGCLLGCAGMVSFILSGWGNAALPDYTLGYIYLPATFMITATSVFTSKWGANAANILPVPVLKKAFAFLLLAMAVNMFFK